METILDRLGRQIARIITRERPVSQARAIDVTILRRVMEPGDVLLVEAQSKVSTAIRYLTQSTWSHAALYVGDALVRPQANDSGDNEPGSKLQTGSNAAADPPLRLIEVNLGEGCVGAPLEKYTGLNLRICRPVGLTPEDRRAVVQFMIDSLGVKYDHKNIFDMLRYFLPTPPVPTRLRRGMIAFGSGDPTRAICSTLIAQAFQSVRYPILPKMGRLNAQPETPTRNAYSRRDILMIRHHSLYTPKDFDISPYFAVVKPTLKLGFDYKRLVWKDDLPEDLHEAIVEEAAEG